VAEPQQLQRAKLVELDAQFKEKGGGHTADVQFNPETLKVSYSNQLAQQGGGGTRSASGQSGGSGTPPAADQTGGASRQYVGAGTTKLALQLWFDVTGERGSAADVTKLTEGVAYFMTPQPLGEHGELLPPNVRFAWGAFSFDGTFDSLEESLEFFSNDGRPLRAQVSFTISQQKIQSSLTAAGSPFGGGAPGTRPLTAAPAGATLQGLAAGLRGGADWQSIASANGIENPRMLAPGQLVDLSLRAPSVSF
jgi:hypothetical protein